MVVDIIVGVAASHIGASKFGAGLTAIGGFLAYLAVWAALAVLRAKGPPGSRETDPRPE